MFLLLIFLDVATYTCGPVGAIEGCKSEGGVEKCYCSADLCNSASKFADFKILIITAIMSAVIVANL